MKRCAVGYLTYINQKNKEKRINDFQSSLKSLSLLKNDQLDFMSIDNSSLQEVTSMLKESKIFSKLFHYQKNYYDVALFYTTLWHAKDNNIDYMCFLYDDSIAYNNSFEEVISFMDSEPDISCTRISCYDYKNQRNFDADITPKSINPDAIRHYNFVTNEKLKWEGPFSVKNKDFYKNNWHYTSRPVVWRTNFFDSVISTQGEKSKVLQGFEGWAQPAFQKVSLKTGVLDKGMIKTTPVLNSARGLEIPSSNEVSININVADLRKEYENCRDNTR